MIIHDNHTRMNENKKGLINEKQQNLHKYVKLDQRFFTNVSISVIT